MPVDVFFKKYPQLFADSSSDYIEDYYDIKDKVRESSAWYHGEPVEFLYQPMLFSKKDIIGFKEIAGALTTILNKTIDEYLTNPDFRKHFQYPELMENLIMVDPGYSCKFPMTRFDIFYHKNNNIKFCELNADGSSGMNESRVLTNLFQDSEVIKDLQQKYEIDTFELFDSWINTVIRNYEEYRENNNVDKPFPPNIAIVDLEGEGVDSEFRVFKRKFENRGYQTVICDPRSMKYIEGKLYYNNMRIDLIYRRVTTSRFVDEAVDAADFISAYKHGDVCVVGGFVSQIIHNKILFSILHDKDKTDYLNEKERNFIKNHIPYTFLLNKADSGQLKEVINNKNSWLLKPCDRFAGQGVYIGRDYSQKEWKKIIDKAKGKDYLIQEFCSVPHKKMLTIEDKKKDGDFYFENYNFILGIYLYNQQFKGIYTRVGRENIIGSIVECYTLPNFIINERR